MAATGAYVRIACIPAGVAYQTDAGPVISNISSTTAAFQLAGGLYGVTVVATNYGTVTLQILGPDDSTYLTAMTAFSANGYATANLPPGKYKVALA